MFTGIIETLGILRSKKNEGSNVRFRIESSIAPELKVDQSLAHNGVCLTIVNVSGNEYEVVAVEETLKRTNLSALQPGDKINLERCVKVDGRLDGHIVQGHIDTTGVVQKIETLDGSWNFYFRHPSDRNYLTVEKGSVCVNGVSLTVVTSGNDTFSVTIIPYTWQNTNFHSLKIGDEVNLEFDILGKYIAKIGRG
jgi:riboflavin synthase